jgi:hypothetical protein
MWQNQESRLKKLVEEIKCSLLRIRNNTLLSNTTLVWLSIFPRLYWHRVPVEMGKKINKNAQMMERIYLGKTTQFTYITSSQPSIFF